MKITISFTPDEIKQADNITSILMGQYMDKGARFKTMDINQHGNYHRYLTLGKSARRGSVKPKDQQPKKSSPVDIQKAAKKLKKHFEKS